MNVVIIYDLQKPEDMNTVPGAHEALTRDVINSFLLIRRRKRNKRRNSSGLCRILCWI
jgi:hypothetical protein